MKISFIAIGMLLAAGIAMCVYLVMKSASTM